MKIFILFTIFFIHSTSGTIDLEKLKDTASTKLQALTDTAATKLQTITDTATTTLQEFAETIDLEKVQKLDVLNLLPKLQYKGKLIKDTYDSLPEYAEKIRSYLQSIKGLKGQDLVLAFDAPWPAKRKVYYHDGYY